MWRYGQGKKLLENWNLEEEIERTMKQRNLLSDNAEDSTKKETELLMGETRMRSELSWWNYVDENLQQAIRNYTDIKKKSKNGKGQPVFMDLIIKLTICRAYTNKAINRYVTAQKILKVAEDLVEKVKDPDHPLVIVEDDDENQRAGAEVIPIEILEQKLILTRGLVCVEFHMKNEAKRHFMNCLNSGHQYDVRVRKECVE